MKAFLALLTAIVILTGCSKANTALSATEADYPKRASYPTDETSGTYLSEYRAWAHGRDEMHASASKSKADSLKGFYTSSAAEFLTGGKSSAYSPMSLYMALSVLAGSSAGDTQREILDLLGAESADSLTTQANYIRDADYCDDGAFTSVMASSLWLRDDWEYNQDTLDRLAEKLYTSSYRGKFGTEEMNTAIRNWLNKQTDGLLEDAVSNTSPDKGTVAALYSTVLFKAGWEDEFNEKANTTDTFHGVSGDSEKTFMHHSSESGSYYRGDNFGAVSLGFVTGGSMWLILPDEDSSVDEALKSGEYMDMVLSDDWENKKSLTINLSLPKFDVSSNIDLKGGLKKLGISEAFTSSADFSPLCDNVCIGSARQSSRVMIDEKGCKAASFTEILISDTALWDEEEMDFTLDRPFIFVIEGLSGQPLFIGTVAD